MLTSQASALNSIFTELSRRAANCLFDGSPGTFERTEAYLRMAMRTQSQCRMTLDTLGTIKNPPVFAKQANIANGPQQVNNGISSRDEKIRNLPNELLLPAKPFGPAAQKLDHSPLGK